MTEFYKAGNYWPESIVADVVDFDAAGQVITLKPDVDDDDDTQDYCNDTSPFGDVIFEEEGDDYDEEDDGDFEYILEELEEEVTRSSGIFTAADDEPPAETAQCEQSQPRLFTEELELLLTNVDGTDSDPDVVVLPQASTSGRRLYRKSMSLPMSPVGGARERYDSINFSEYLLSPLKLNGFDLMEVEEGDEEDEDVDMNDITMAGDFNLINFIGQDPVAPHHPPAVVSSEPVLLKAKQETVVVVNPDPVKEKKEVKVQVKPAAPPVQKPLSKGKCLQLLRETHERQENLVKRCGAMGPQKVAKVVVAAAAKSKKIVPKADTSLKDDPNWMPEPQYGIKKTNRKAKEPPVAVTVSKGTTSSSLVSGASNMTEIKRRFLANAPLCSSVVSRKMLPKPLQHVIRSHVPIMPPSDHNYCSPVKRVLPFARTHGGSAAKGTKSAILIEEAPSVIKRKSPKKVEPPPVVVSKPEEKVVVVKQEVFKEEVLEPPPAAPQAPKRRAINLEDYKKLRGGVGENKLAVGTKASSTCTSSRSNSSSTTTSSSNSLLKTSCPSSVASESVVTATVPLGTDTVPVKEEKYLDPISVAKEKALRMQERRRAARIKQEELQIKTPLVPILPLAVMTGLISEEKYLQELRENEGKTTLVKQEVEEYEDHLFEEIMIVSVGCNTQLTIRPDFEATALLSNLSNQMRTKAPLTSNSLLFSIQDVVIKKTTATVPSSPDSSALSPSAPETAGCSPGKPEGAAGADGDHATYHHGEDKVIMHLRRDRVRPKLVSVDCQTDCTPEFPPLELVAKKAGQQRRYRRRSLSRTSTDSDSYSERSHSSQDSDSDSEQFSESEDEFGRSAKRRRLYSRSSRSRSCIRSRSTYRSRSPHRRSWSRQGSRSRSREMSVVGGPAPVSGNNNKNRWRGKNPSPEERRIVYVGRLEPELTKEDLRRKFIGYGTVKLVTLHEKTNGTRYGFVTFEEPADAFKAIESAKEDPQLQVYDVGFGGRRAFCGASYADLDNVETEEDMYGGGIQTSASALTQPEESFESLLLSFKRKVAAVAP